MSLSSDWAIEIHNEAMAMDADYAADYMRHMEEAYFAGWGAEYSPEPDYRLDYTGYEEFRCPLCPGFADNDFGHKECFDAEQAWADRNFEFFN